MFMELGIWQDWKIEKTLGKGSYGVVYKAIKREAGFESCAAIKVVTIPQSKSEITSLVSEGMTDAQCRTYLTGVVKSFVNEIKIMESLKGHPNIVSVEDYKVIEDADDMRFDIYILNIYGLVYPKPQ